MKKAITYLTLCLAMLSCTSKQGNDSTTDSTKKTVMTPPNTGPFDISHLVLKENLPDLMAAQGIKSEPITASDLTLLGYDVFKSSNPKLLRFGGKDLSGSVAKDKNHLLLHYNTEKKILAFYEVDLYTREQIDILSSQLKKMGPPSFEKKWPDGSLTIDENGNSVKPDPDEKQTFQVWENKSTGLTYFFSNKESKKGIEAELTVLKKSEQSGKDWMSFSQLDWYR
jgi:hypothetical protein